MGHDLRISPSTTRFASGPPPHASRREELTSAIGHPKTFPSRKREGLGVGATPDLIRGSFWLGPLQNNADVAPAHPLTPSRLREGERPLPTHAVRRLSTSLETSRGQVTFATTHGMS
ncbi:hypothetical protein Sj15T_29240 [Sphingobium sp. TA15]|nr:hypothetical protein Sj15T_29240 [Sphingobium sp. TA15]